MFDPQKRQHRIRYAQNFLTNPSLARYLVGRTAITPDDTVVEIGPGRGIITSALAAKTPHLILVEKDRELFQKLYEKYKTTPTVKVIHTDARDYRVPPIPYMVVSNPPFNILSQLVKKFVFHSNAPEALYLFMQLEAQRRMSGKPTESQLSIIIKTWYRIKELHHFKRTDFSPVPAVDINFVAFTKKVDVPIANEDKREYILFVQYGFQQQKTTLEKNFERIFTHEQWKRLASNLGFPPKAQPTDLTVEQWTGLFTYYKSGVSSDKQRIIQTFLPRD